MQSKKANQTTKSKNARKNAVKKQTRRKPRPQTQARQKRQRLQLSDCADIYLRAIAHPFSPNISNACVPDLYDIPSSKYCVQGRGTFAAGTQGMGFICLDPKRVLASNALAGAYSGSTYAGDTVTLGAAGTSTFTLSQAPYDTGDFGVEYSEIQGRTVACGIRIRYIGTNLDMGGRVILYRPQAGVISADDQTIGQMLSDRTTMSLPVSRMWRTLSWLPMANTDYEYITDIPTGVCEPRITIGIESKAANQFEYQVIAYVEYTGAITNKSPSHSDIVGMSAIRNATNSTSEVQPAGEDLYERWSRFIGLSVSKGASTVVEGVTDMAARKAVAGLSGLL